MVKSISQLASSAITTKSYSYSSSRNSDVGRDKAACEHASVRRRLLREIDSREGLDVLTDNLPPSRWDTSLELEVNVIEKSLSQYLKDF